MNKEKVAVIGGAGFIGSRLASRFDKKKSNYIIYDINTVSRNDTKYLNVEDSSTLEQLKGSNSIVNLAAVHRDDVRPLSRYDDVNVQGAVNLCNAARKHNIDKILFTSSVAIYGFAAANTDESGKPNYFNDYGRTKFAAEGIYKAWQEEDPDNRTLVIIRPTVVFGEGNRGNVFNLLKQVASKKFVMFGGGKNIKSMAYVENVAAFIEYSLAFKAGTHIFNYIDKPDLDMNSLISHTRKILFGTENVGLRLPAVMGISIGYFFDLFSHITKISLPVSSIRMKKFMKTTQFSSSVKETAFVAPISLEEGLSQTVIYEFLEDNTGQRTFFTE